MKAKLFIFFIFLNYFTSYSQAPLVKIWDKRFGGDNWDESSCLQQTSDGGYILGGEIQSQISGDVNQASVGTWDYWVVKMDSLGAKQWVKRFGGIGEDDIYFLQQTYDGGYIVGGTSYSPAGGDKTQPLVGVSDFWIIKIDSSGTKQWDKDFGGSEADIFYTVCQSIDHGYLLGGWSYSGISGDKTQNNWDASHSTADYWIVKIDSSGNKQWDKRFGGLDDDELYKVQQTADSGYILGGYSLSGASGDKSQYSRGGYDYWIVKIDSVGNKQWDKRFGGSNTDGLLSMSITSDGGYILGGLTFSDVGGDKTQPVRGIPGDEDYWIVKVNSAGVKQWDKDFGGTNTEDQFGTVSQTLDHGYLLAGTSYSQISGDKTENNLGTEQTWIIKTDSLGIKEWDKTVFTSGHDEGGFAIQARDGCYIVLNYDNGGIGGYRSQANWGSWDFWSVKLCEMAPVTAFTNPPTLCPGSCVDFTNLSQGGTTFLWMFPGASTVSSTDVNPSNICYNSPGNYDVTLIATNSLGSDTLTITNAISVYPYPPPQGIIQNSDTLFANPGSVSYQWYYGGNLIPGATSYLYIATQNGDYNVVATDSNGCEVEAVVFNVMTGLTPALSKEDGVTVFPNPVEGKLTVDSRHPDSYREASNTIAIYNLMGELVLTTSVEKTFSQGRVELDVHSLSPGVYILKLIVAEKTFRTKFIKE